MMLLRSGPFNVDTGVGGGFLGQNGSPESVKKWCGGVVTRGSGKAVWLHLNVLAGGINQNVNLCHSLFLFYCVSTIWVHPSSRVRRAI